MSVSDFKLHEGVLRVEYVEDFGDIFETSTVTDLNLVLNPSSDPCLGTPDSLILLALPKILTRLSVYFKRHPLFTHANLCNPFDIWNDIQQYAGSIEYLDVYGYPQRKEPGDDEEMGIKGTGGSDAIRLLKDIRDGTKAAGFEK